MLFLDILGDFKEGYYIGIEILEDDPHAEKPFYGRNQWPSEGKIIDYAMKIFSLANIANWWNWMPELYSPEMSKLIIKNAK